MTSRPDPTATNKSSDAGDERVTLRARAREAIIRQPSRIVTVLSSLLAVQDDLGYLPPEAIEEVADQTSVSPNEVWGVASFYPNFRFTIPGRHKIEICWGPTCHVLGAQQTLQGLLPHLGLENEGDTDDGAITLKLNTCLGVCPHAPAMSFDERLVGHIDLAHATQLLQQMLVDDEKHQRAASALKPVGDLEKGAAISNAQTQSTSTHRGAIDRTK